MLGLRILCLQLAKSDIHGLFDYDKFLLLPDDDIINEFYDSLIILSGGLHYVAREKFPVLPVCLLYHDLTWSF
jgi:hypothetical protein